jgi:hypothetical protein
MGHKIRRESPLIHTGLQPGDHRTRGDKNRFNGFSAGLGKGNPCETQAIGCVEEASEPVETVNISSSALHLAKAGVNEKRSGRNNLPHFLVLVQIPQNVS